MSILTNSVSRSRLARPHCAQILCRHVHLGEKAHHQPIEELLLPRYYERQYYPVKIGDVFKDQYRLISKLGYGAYSTVWLAWDKRASRYASLKVCVQDDGTPESPILNEVAMLRRLKKFAAEEESPGLFFTRLADDIFELHTPSGARHYVIASKPQGSSARVLQEWYPDGGSCQSFLKAEEQESQTPSIPITPADGRAPVYPTRQPDIDITGLPILTDFGQMRIALEGGNREWCMPDVYRAPEVVLRLAFSLDMWSIGVMTLELLEGKNLFNHIDRDNSQYVLPLALAQYIGYLGAPPLELIRQSPIFSDYFDKDGKFLHEEIIPQIFLEKFVTTIPPGEEKEQFLRFMQKLLTWDPEARANSYEICDDEWLMRPVETLS
ncbi:serine/threonine protein kinase [Helicocarpus griseus UAMH5409]|uniref:non-specific serine/threonine protein kinase n=1 Tax=Helicocarpus griseus UAMH5409 TaxID=1447875 RepID=A0A2B7Y1E1_9EURO|nr:serine/threonine protein kinase [Helicocarpus griseus UAMH5409]